MKTSILTASLVASALAVTSASAAVNPFTETFNASASNWLSGASTAPTYNATGGVANSGYIGYTSTFTSASTGVMGSPPLQLLFRGNNANDASGDAFVGNWFTAGIDTLTVSARHNYSQPLDLFARIDSGQGAAASLATGFTIAPNTWTTITIPITNSNPPFLSFGAGTYSSVFSNVQNVQFGLYVPGTTTFTNLTFDIDNVAVTPEPTTLALLGLGGLMLRRRAR